MKNKTKTVLLCFVIFFSLFIVWALWGNTALELNTYTISSGGVPKAFDEYRIAQVSDFHNAEIGKGNKKLLSVLESANPDIIVITGDIIDWRSTDVNITLNFIKEALKIAPCYYVTGNNEAYVTETCNIKELLKNTGVVILENEVTELELSDEKILLVGVDDPTFSKVYSSYDSVYYMHGKLETLITDDEYTVLLSHRPELFSVYCEYGVDLVFSGHAHGGQFRIPFVGGVYAPDQGLFPEYDAGLYTQGNTNMIVSRGIGNSKIPLRINNRPEVILIELKAEG